MKIIIFALFIALLTSYTQSMKTAKLLSDIQFFNQFVKTTAASDDDCWLKCINTSYCIASAKKTQVVFCLIQATRGPKLLE